MNTLSPEPITVQELLSSRVEISSPPEVFLKVSEILDDPTKNTSEAARVIENDPGLCIRLLKIVNSAFFGYQTEIVTVSRAITVVGVNQLRNLVLATVVVDRFSELPSTIPSMREFWSTSIRTGLLCSEIAARRLHCADPSSLFVCGLLHNIGGLIIFSRYPEQGESALKSSAEHNSSIAQGERNQFGFDRFDVGGELARMWKLPILIQETISNHESPDCAADYPQETLIVSQSDHIIQNSITNDAGEYQFPAESLARLELDVNDVSEISEQLELKFARVFRQIFE